MTHPSAHLHQQRLASLASGTERAMKRASCSHGFLPLLLLLLVVTLSSVHGTRASRFLSQPRLGGKDVRADDLPLPSHAAEMEEKYPWELMGLDKCKEGDEECLKGRMISEAHLDYIYTQHHKP